MTEASAAEFENQPTGAEPGAVLRYRMARRLGQIASYVTQISETVRDSLQPLPDEDTYITQQALHELAQVMFIANNGDTAAAVVAYEALPPLSFLDGNNRLRGIYPNVPFYKEIIAVEAETSPAADVIMVRIVGPRHISINDTVIELEGDVLYMFNALLLHRNELTKMVDFLKYGFRKSQSPHTDSLRANRAIRKLCRQLADVLPPGMELVQRIGKGSATTRQLSPQFVIVEDARDNPEPAYVAPRRSAKLQTTDRAAVVVDHTIAGFANQVDMDPTSAPPVTGPEEYDSSPGPLLPQDAANTAGEGDSFADSQPEPPAVPKPELSRQTELSTAEQIVALIQAEHGLTVTTAQVNDAASEISLIKPVDQNGQPTYSQYAIRKIIAALVAHGSS